jgi:predicted DNA-binding transcriptional regulator AlpA
MRAMNLHEVLAVAAVSKGTVYRLMREGRFPKQRKLAGTRKSVWIEDEVQDWLKKAVATSVASVDGTRAP